MAHDSPDKVPLNTQIPAELKDRLVAYATDRGISQAAAQTILLGDALTREGYPRVATR